jgi:hypothetical protein
MNEELGSPMNPSSADPEPPPTPETDPGPKGDRTDKVDSQQKKS